jgi:hypothetical protein
MDNVINSVNYGSIGLATFFLLMAYVVIPNFNLSYNTSVTGIASGFITGMLALVFFLAVIGIGIRFIPKMGGGKKH